MTEQSKIQTIKSKIHLDPYLWLTLLLTIFAVAPFLLPGYFWGANDARHHVYFLYEYNRNVQDGIWWPRWSPDFTFGYGYPFFNIYGLLSHFIAEVLLHFLGFDYTGAIKAVFAISIVGSAATMYLFVRDWAGRRAGLISALVYTYIPYHLLNLYVRANISESMAMLWPPLILWAVRRAIRKPSWWALLCCALSYGGLMLTSNLVIVLFTPWLGIYLLVVAWQKSLEIRRLEIERSGAAIGNAQSANPPSAQSLRAFVYSLLLPGFGLLAGLGLSANFWIPMLLERNDVRVDQWFDGRYDFRPHFVYFQQLFSTTWGFGISLPGANDTISLQIGLAAFVLAVIGLLLAWQKRSDLRLEIGFFAFGTFASIFLALQIAAPLWDLPLIGSILRAAQFPWRWYSIMAVCISILAGLVVADPKDSDLAASHPVSLSPLLSTLILAAMVILVSYPYLQVQIRPPAEGPVGLPAMMAFQRNSDEMTGSTRWVKEIPRWSPIAEHYTMEAAAGKEVTPVTTLTDFDNFDYRAESCFAADSRQHTVVSEQIWFCNRKAEGEAMIFNHFYYPGWHAWLLDGENGNVVRELPIIPATNGVTGRMTVPLPLGEGYLLLRFEDTPPRQIGKAISLLTIAGLLLLSLYFSSNRKLRFRASST